MATLTQNLHKRNVRELFSDQRFLLALGLFLFSIAAFLIHLFKNRDVEPLEANNLNTTIPSAVVDSIPNGSPEQSKLDLLVHARESVPMPLPGADGPSSLTSAGIRMQSPNGSAVSPSMALPGFTNSGSGSASQQTTTQAHSRPEASVPGSLDRYMYRKNTPSDEEFKALSEYYEPDLSRSGEIPSPSRNRSVSRDDDDMPTASPAVQYKKAQDLNRLKTLLEEYKRDKEAKAAVRQEAELKPRKLGQADVVSGLDGIDRSRNGFYGLFSQETRQEGEIRDEAINGTFRAVINQNQTVLSGGRVQLRLLDDMTIQNIIIPRGTLVYGVGNFGSERVAVQITSVQLHDRIYPIKLSVYDMDGLPGIYVPKVVGVQEGRQATAQAIGGVNISTASGSNLGQAATASAAQAGVRGVQNLFQRKAQLQKATLKGNYYVLLR